jgi:UDP-glucose:(heptosyl)LPS alpha-1,3-glucosyltransferase
MRIGLVIEEFDPHRGGVEHWTVQFTAQLLERGHEVHVVARRFCDRALRMPIIAHGLEGVDSRLGFAAAAEQTLRRMDLDVIHDMGAGWHCNVFQPHGGSRRAATQRNLMLVPPWMRGLKAAFQRFLPRYRQFNALVGRQYADDGRIVLALSRQVAEDFQRYHDVPREQIRLIYNGVDTQRFSPEHRETYREMLRRRLGIPADTVLMLIVAHNFRLKGVPTLLRTMGRLRQRGRRAHLVVVGGKNVGTYRRAAGRAGAAGAVTFTGSVEDTVPYYAAADLYVQPTFYDPCSLVVLEALASGLPIVTSRYNGAGELLTEGREGFLISDPHDARELQDCVEKLFHQPTRTVMGEAARQLSLRHTLQRNVEEVLAVYEEIAERRRAERLTQEAASGRFVFRRRIGAEGGVRSPSHAPAEKSAHRLASRGLDLLHKT